VVKQALLGFSTNCERFVNQFNSNVKILWKTSGRSVIFVELVHSRLHVAEGTLDIKGGPVRMKAAKEGSVDINGLSAVVYQNNGNPTAFGLGLSQGAFQRLQRGGRGVKVLPNPTRSGYSQRRIRRPGLNLARQ
jgi:hypothetical protein